MSEDDERQQSPPSDLEFVSNKARNCNATGSGSGHPEFQSTYPDQVLENVLNVLGFKELVLVCCDGFGISGLAIFVNKCSSSVPDRDWNEKAKVVPLPLKGKMSCLMINDIDAGLGRFVTYILIRYLELYIFFTSYLGNTQMTVNNQIVVGTLMNLSDNPTRVSIRQDWRESDITNRVPIIVTGNDFSTIYAPLIRDGRMEKFYRQPTKEDIVNIVHRMYEKDGISKDEVVSIVDMDILISLVQAG
ncbi:hypothetical protein CXB51_031751 [Gossypium anomalum]|uniref:Uncharacterized protein n=1 Tax=Gossypium anomalum TaxID=47600 RepID=A0A8J5XTY9_9ROSI|nr:hypothetical protein CXB51_031751 [Gossypium anomalum]